MCDYSLMGVDNRLATEGDELVTYRFVTGSMGLAPAAEVRAHQDWESAQDPKGTIAKLRQLAFGAPEPGVCAVCVQPGTELRVEFPDGKRKNGTFDQLSMETNQHRDAIRFPGGHATLLQNLQEGVRVTVVSLAGAIEREPVEEFVLARRR